MRHNRSFSKSLISWTWDWRALRPQEIATSSRSRDLDPVPLTSCYCRRRTDFKLDERQEDEFLPLQEVRNSYEIPSESDKIASSNSHFIRIQGSNLCTHEEFVERYYSFIKLNVTSRMIWERERKKNMIQVSTESLRTRSRHFNYAFLLTDARLLFLPLLFLVYPAGS